MKKFFFLLLIILCGSSFVPPKTLWIAIGDSITYLNEHPDEAGNRITKGYMTRVVEKIPDIEYINQGHNGWTSGGIADKIEELGLVRADVYSVFWVPMIGGPAGRWVNGAIIKTTPAIRPSMVPSELLSTNCATSIPMPGLF